MKRFLFFILLIFAMSATYAQEPERPRRTPEEEAEKYTQMLQRELGLDSIQRDTVYKINLKYARLRRISNTRAENLDRMNRLTTELQGVLTAKQFNAFMNRQVEVAPHRPAQPMPMMRKPSAVDTTKAIQPNSNSHQIMHATPQKE